MQLEQSIHPSQEGMLIFMRPGRAGLEPVEVQTEFSSAELAQILALGADGSGWFDLKQVIDSVSGLGSGFARQMQTDNFIGIPQGYGLKSRQSTILKLNVLAAATASMPTSIEIPSHLSFLTQTFVQQDPEFVSGALLRTAAEVQSVLAQNAWQVDIESEKPEAMTIIRRIQQLKGLYGIE